MRTSDRQGPQPRWRRAAALCGAALALGLGLGGCVSLLPRSPPVQLYQFGQLPPPLDGAGSPGAPATPGVDLALAAVTLPRAASGDQILTIEGQEAAYIAGARWATAAGAMFQADAERAFERQARRVRLLPRGDSASAVAALRLDVGDFEARYDAGAGAAPTVLVSVRATLTGPDGDLLAQRTFTTAQPAARNRVGAIVSAFDAAVAQVLAQVTSWTDRTAPAATNAGFSRAG